VGREVKILMGKELVMSMGKVSEMTIRIE
jgi:hypothetical protein